MSVHDSEAIQRGEHLVPSPTNLDPSRFRFRAFVMATILLLAWPRLSNATSGDGRCVHWVAATVLEIQASTTINLNLKGGCQRPERDILYGENCYPCTSESGPTLSGVYASWDTLGYKLECKR